MNSTSAKPCISIVVIGRNEGSRLRNCLLSAQQVDHSTFDLEIIYVDSASTDNSLAIAEELGVRSIALHPEHPTAALGRNAGWRASRGDFVFFLDGDSYVQPGFLAKALPWFYSEPMLAAAFGQRRERHPERSLYNRVLDLDWYTVPGLTEFCGGDAIFRRSALEAGNGYDDSLIAGEEPDLCRRLHDFGYHVRCIDADMSTHDMAMYNFRQYWRRALRSGHAFAEIASRYRHTSRPMWSKGCRQNLIVAAVQSLAILATLIASLLLRSVLPLLLLLSVAALLTLNTMWRRRYMTKDLLTLALYSIHGHAQQIPIAIGQLGFLLRRNQRKQLIEYK